jgi:hypothetical protein
MRARYSLFSAFSSRAATAALGCLLTACRVAHIEPFGETKLDSLCEDAKRCDARGDSVTNLLSKTKAQRLYLSPEKGPEQLLGKVAPKRDAGSVLKTCGADIALADVVTAPEEIRDFALGSHAKEELRQRLHAYLSSRTAALSIPDKQTVDSSLSAIIHGLQLDRASWVSQTYWLTDGAFERRVGQCGEEERKNIVYSLTVLSPSQAFQADLTSKLAQALSATLSKAGDAGVEAGAEPVATSETPAIEVPAASDEEADAGVPTHDTLARDVVRALARDTRVVAALGFDDP